MISQYENGAVHNDHHQEMYIQAGILTEESLAKLMADFFTKDDNAQAGNAQETYTQDVSKQEVSEEATLITDETTISENIVTGASSSFTSGETCSEETCSEEYTPYPPIGEAQASFFKKTRFVEGDERDYLAGGRAQPKVGTPKQKIPIPLEELMHCIYRYTHENGWVPNEKNSVHRWKMLYQLLKNLKFFDSGEKEKYKAFVDAVVRYCFSEVGDKYNNNISKALLPDDFTLWEKEDKREYLGLKEILMKI